MLYITLYIEPTINTDNNPTIPPIKAYTISINLNLRILMIERTYKIIKTSIIIFVIMEKSIIEKSVENIDEIKFIIKTSFINYLF